MRVLLVSDNYLPNRDGIATSVVSLATGLSQLGHNVAILAPRTGSPIPDADRRTIYLAPSFPTGQGGYRFAWMSSKSLARIVQTHRPDIVHIHTLGPLGLLAAAYCRRIGLKCTLTWHTDLLAYRKSYPILNVGIPTIYTTSLLPMSLSGTAKMLGKTALTAAAKGDLTSRHREMLSAVAALFDRIIVPSSKTASLLAEMIPGRITHIIPAAAVRHEPLDPASALELRAVQRNINHGESVIAYVGRLSPEKNVKTLLRILSSHVLPAFPSARLNIIGDGNEKRSYQAMASTLGISRAVAFAGPVPPQLVGHLLESCGVLAHPSLTETQGLVITEAALARVPSVILDAELKEIVQHGHTGYVTASESHFGAALTRLLERPDIRDRLARNAHRLAASYTPAQYASRVVEIYNDSIAHNPPPANSCAVHSTRSIL